MQDELNDIEFVGTALISNTNEDGWFCTDCKVWHERNQTFGYEYICRDEESGVGVCKVEMSCVNRKASETESCFICGEETVEEKEIRIRLPTENIESITRLCRSRACHSNMMALHKQDVNFFVCACCEKIEERSQKMKRCAGCKSVRYCSRECQVKDWSLHKSDCK